MNIEKDVLSTNDIARGTAPHSLLDGSLIDTSWKETTSDSCQSSPETNKEEDRAGLLKKII